MKRLLGITAICLMIISVMAAPASAVENWSVTASSGSLAAEASFTINNDTLTIVLSNTSTFDVLVPADVLTGLFFSLNRSLTTVSALISPGSSAVYGSSLGAGDNVGGEWAYANGLSGAPLGANSGISSSGLGLFGGANFNGPNLTDPLALDGLQWGLLSAGDNIATGNNGVKKEPAVKNSVTFTLTGVLGLKENDFSNISFQYGTDLSEPNIHNGHKVPEPGMLALLGMGLVGIGIFRRRK